MVSFVVPGNPVPQPRPRWSRRSGLVRAYVPAKHPVHAFRRDVQLAASAAGLRHATTPVRVVIICVFKRPKSHYTRRGLKPSAPLLPRPDVDNLAKAVLDAMSGFFDDTLVAKLLVEKVYGDEPHTEVTVCTS